MQVNLLSLQNNTNISVLVIVLDVNDNNPVFNPNNGSVTLSGEETTGHVITVVNVSYVQQICLYYKCISVCIH